MPRTSTTTNAPAHAIAAPSIGLCPSTEANLGDGVFDAPAWRGAWGIGSDSHASVDAAEELRLLEYTQRLAQRQRNVLADAQRPERGRVPVAVGGGRRRAGQRLAPVAAWPSGQQADFVVLGDALLAGLTPAAGSWPRHVFASQRRHTVQEVWVGGHDSACRMAGTAARTAAAERFVAARRRLLSEL